MCKNVRQKEMLTVNRTIFYCFIAVGDRKTYRKQILGTTKFLVVSINIHSMSIYDMCMCGDLTFLAEYSSNKYSMLVLAEIVSE